MSWYQNMNWTDTSGKIDKVGTSRKFGIELETSDCGDYYDWANGRSWGVKEDGSVSGMEFVSPPLWGNDGADSVMDFCGRMVDAGCEVDDRCGFHLHVDLSDTTAKERKSIALAYHYTRKFWAACVDSSRRDTYYARYSDDSRYGKYWDRNDIMEADDKPYTGWERYIWCNWNAFDNHKTLEIRSHEATCDGRTVLNWARAHALFIDYVKGLTTGQVTRIFGNGSVERILSELKFIWKDNSLHAFYADKIKANDNGEVARD